MEVVISPPPLLVTDDGDARLFLSPGTTGYTCRVSKVMKDILANIFSSLRNNRAVRTAEEEPRKTTTNAES